MLLKQIKFKKEHEANPDCLMLQQTKVDRFEYVCLCSVYMSSAPGITVAEGRPLNAVHKAFRGSPFTLKWLLIHRQKIPAGIKTRH